MGLRAGASAVFAAGFDMGLGADFDDGGFVGAGVFPVGFGGFEGGTD